MAFLKSSQITGLAPRDLDVRGFTQADSINLDGSYTEHEVLLADAYNIKGNVTVSDNLILSKLSDDGDDITITGDSVTRTISGSGSIEGATLAQTPNADMTGMTGTLGSGVTNNAGVASGTIASGVVFPTGHIVKYNPIKWGTYTGVINTPTTNDAYTVSNLYDTITFTPGNRIVAMGNIYLHAYDGGSDTAGECQFSTDGTVNGRIGATGEQKGAARARMYITNSTKYAQHNILMGELENPPGSSVTITLGFYAASGGTVDFGAGSSWMQLFEVQA